MSPPLQLSLQERLDLVKRSTLRSALALLCAALCAGLLAACGDADDPSGDAAAGAVAQTVAATSELKSAKLTASFRLDPEGLLALGGPIALRASGPFAAGAAGELPRFDLAIGATLARNDLRARAISTGKRGFLRIDGRDYEIDRDFLDGLLSHAKQRKPGGAGLASLGLDPSAWVKDPTPGAGETVGGVDTTRVSGEIDVEDLLDDVAKLLGGDLLTPKLRDTIEDAVTSTKVDVWSGARDRILRRLAVVVDFAFEPGRSPVSGLDGGRITLGVRLDGVNATTVDPVAPKRPRPLAQLTGEGGLGALLSGLGAGILGGTGGGDGGDAFLKCLSSAGGRTADVVACTSKLAP